MVNIKTQYKGDKHFYPNLLFDNGSSKTSLPEDEQAELNIKVFNRCEAILRKLKEKFGSENTIEAFRDKTSGIITLKIACPVRNCSFKGNNLKRHLINIHTLTPDICSLYQSYSTRMFNQLTKINISKQPTVCIRCKVVYANIEEHLQNYHMIEKGTNEMGIIVNECHKYLESNPIIWNNLLLASSGKPFDRADVKNIATPFVSNCSKKKRGNILNSSRRKVMTSEFILTQNIRKEDFKCYFENAEDALDGFERYCNTSRENSLEQSRTYKNNVMNIWKTVDKTLSFLPNLISDLKIIEEAWLDPNILLLKKQLEIPMIARERKQALFYQASTLRTKLLSISYFFEFLLIEQCYIGITAQDMVIFNLTVTQFTKKLNRLERKRKMEIRKYKCDNLINEKDFFKFFQSYHIKKQSNKLDSLLLEEECSKIPTIYECCDCRNYIMVTLTVINALRSSNIINITLHDIEHASTHDTYKNAMFIESTQYKTSLLYGPKIILISMHLYDQIKTYIKHMRPLVTKDDHLAKYNRYLFTCSEANLQTSKPTAKISQSAVSSMISSSFKKSKILDGDKRYGSVSPSRIRISVATDLANLTCVDRDALARCHMMHGKKTMLQYYEVVWNYRDGIRIAGLSQDRYIDGKVQSDLSDFFQDRLRSKASETSTSNEERSENNLQELNKVQENTTSATDNKATNSKKRKLVTPVSSENKKTKLETTTKEFDSTDWYKAHKYSKTLVFTILAIAKELVVGDIKISKETFFDQVSRRLEINNDHSEELYLTSWNTIRNVLRCMRKKYESESGERKAFHLMVKKADAWFLEKQFL